MNVLFRADVHVLMFVWRHDGLRPESCGHFGDGLTFSWFITHHWVAVDQVGSTLQLRQLLALGESWRSLDDSQIGCQGSISYILPHRIRFGVLDWP